MVELWIDRLNVLQSDGLTEKHLVEGQRKTTVNIVTMKNGQTNDSTDKVKVGEVVLKETKISKTKKSKNFLHLPD